MTTHLSSWRRLSDLIDDAMYPRGQEGLTAALDILESDSDYEVILDLPGVAASDVDIEFREGRLWIRGERKSEPQEDGRKHHRVERRTGKFRRVIGLPEDIASDRIEATFRDGVLRVRVPKSEAVKPRKIEIQAG